MDEKYKGEEALRSSGLEYTVVRPGGLNNEPAGQKKLIAAQGDTQSGSVARADVAAVCVAALSDPAAKGVTMELVSSKEEGVDVLSSLGEQLKGMFSGLKKDS